ncbi:MAG: serine/threonine protein kinase [Alcaligenaceae bacterium]|nr:MAG: serine/threonine protein kinase [Alcaligenaceae bacterium]
MPDLDEKVVQDIKLRLNSYLKDLGNYGEPQYLSSGGSAAVFKVEGPTGLRAFKGCNPELLVGSRAEAERRRLDIQRRLLNHSCKSLVQTYRIEEAQGSVFTEMEFVEWPSLKKVLDKVPDESVASLFSQLVNTVKFLDENNIIHRDIKPENIHISSDFTNLKLLDLGVSRELETAKDTDAAITDSGDLRPFLATAQYSSPEYLFRLDQPSEKLWKGLNFYQLGAVLHDLIMKEPIFNHEMSLGNRWLVARAVLTKLPTFSDGKPTRLANLKALSAKCLVKDIDSRLQLIGWEDFILEGAKDPLMELRARLEKKQIISEKSTSDSQSRLDFDRNEFIRRFTDSVRAELLPSCGTNMPMSVKPSAPGENPHTKFTLTVNKQLLAEFVTAYEWQAGFHSRSVRVKLQAMLVCSGYEDPVHKPITTLVSVGAIQENEQENSLIVAKTIASLASKALDHLESNTDPSLLHGIDLQS